MREDLKAKVLVFSLCFFTNLARHSLIETWNVSKPQIETDLSFSSITLGAIDMIYLFSYAAGNVVNGLLSDTSSPKLILAYGMLISSFSHIFVIFTQILMMASCLFTNPVLYFIFFAISGFFQGSVWVCAVSIMGNWFSLHNRGKVMGFWIINTSLGNIIGAQVSTGMIGAGAKWYLVCILFLYVYVLSFFLFSIFCEEKPSELTEEKVNLPCIPFIKALELPNVFIYSVIMACSKLINYSFLMWLPLFTINKLNLGEFEGGVLSSLYDIGGLIGSILFGWISDRLNNRIFLFFPLYLGALPLLLTFDLASDSTLWIFFIIIPLVGMILGGVSLLISSAVAADLGENSSSQYNAKTTVVGIIDGSGGIGAGIGQIIIGLLQRISWDSVFYFIFIVNAIAICAMVPLVLRGLKKPKLEKEIEIDVQIS